MSSRFLLFHKADGALRTLGPTDTSDPNSLVAITGATCTGRLYDESKRAPVVATVAEAQTTVFVDHVNQFEDADAIEVLLDNGSRHATTVVSLDTVADSLVMADAVPGGRSIVIGAVIQHKLGDDITMTQYGTPVPIPKGTPPEEILWGYRGVIADTHVGLRVGQSVRIEIEFDGGAGLRLPQVIDAMVAESEG